MNLLTSHEEGQGLAEYGWTIVLIAILLILLLVLLGATVFGLWDGAVQELLKVF